MNEEIKIDLTEKKENKFFDSKIIECIAFALFVILSIVMFVYHEPWYDEIQAWMAAADASIKDIIFTLPHFEGHPPIWQLILSVFAKNGVTMEIGLRIVSFAFSASAAAIIMFKAPFKRWIRLCIPFTYFLFYQYNVICRPYSMLMLGFVLAAWFYKQRNEKPIRYLLALYLMCISSAYGILFAGTFCLIWTYEIIRSLIGKGFWKRAAKDIRTWSLTGMLLMTILLLKIIWPASNAFAQVRAVDFSKIKCLIYMFLMAPADSLITDVSLMGRLQQNDYIVCADYVTFMCIGLTILISAILIITAHIFRKKALLILPYTAFALYGALGYFYNHHMGIIPLFLIFFFWCMLDERPKEIVLPKFLQKLEESVKGFSKKTGYFFLIVSIGVSMFWTVMAVKNDIVYADWYAKELGETFNEYHLDEYKVLTQWTYGEINPQQNTDMEQIEQMEEEQNKIQIVGDIPQLEASNYYQYVKMCNFVDLLAYTNQKENFIYNFNNGDPNNRYVNHDMLSQEESLEYLKELGGEGYPEIIIGDPEVLGMIGLDANKYKYIPIYLFTCHRINKYNALYARSYVYAREDIFVTRTDWPIYDQINAGMFSME